MKYGKLLSEELQIKEVEKGMEVGGSITEEEIIAQGYKPLCEIKKPTETSIVYYREYNSCIVQEWETDPLTQES